MCIYIHTIISMWIYIYIHMMNECIYIILVNCGTEPYIMESSVAICWRFLLRRIETRKGILSHLRLIFWKSSCINSEHFISHPGLSRFVHYKHWMWQATLTEFVGETIFQTKKSSVVRQTARPPAGVPPSSFESASQSPRLRLPRKSKDHKLKNWPWGFYQKKRVNLDSIKKLQSGPPRWLTTSLYFVNAMCSCIPCTLDLPEIWTVAMAASQRLMEATGKLLQKSE